MHSAIELDFATKSSRPVELDALPSLKESTRSLWLDLDLGDPDTVRRILGALEVPSAVLEHVFDAEDNSRYDTYGTGLHVAVTTVSLGDEALRRARIDVVLGERFLVTLSRGEPAALGRVKRSYQEDFQRFAQTLGFLLFELFDFLVDEYRRAIRAQERAAERFQTGIFGEVDDAIFNDVARVTRELLSFRAALTGARDVLHQLATRRSSFVSESTQPFLQDLVGALERLGADLDGAREVLAESLNLYMSIVSHRTNRVVSRLTAVSVIFMPLTFLCGVYGMNFRRLPELQWDYGYLLFWLLVLSISATLLVLMKRWRWI